LQDKPSYAEDFGDSDQEDEPDAYLARVKAEAEERDEGEGGESEDESTDEDFNPDQQESDVAEEWVTYAVGMLKPNFIWFFKKF